MIELLNVDCMEYMRGLPDKAFDLVLTDPPYGLGIPYNSFDDTLENVSAMAHPFVNEARRIAHRVAFTPGTDRMFIYPAPDWVYGWITLEGSGSTSYGFQCWQPIMYYGKDAKLSAGKGRHPDIIRWSGTCSLDKSLHPCPKPVEFFRRCLHRFANPGDKILDPFLGSGSSAIAADMEGFDFVGMDIDAIYVDGARKRLALHQSAPPLFPAA